MPTDRKLRVAVECRIDDPRSGVGSAILALAHALSESKNLDQEYTFIVNDDAKAWLEPHIFGSCHLVGIERPRPSRIKPIFRNLTLLRTIWRSLRVLLFNPPKSDGYVESNGFDIVHFPTPSAYLTGLPSIYQPWDLQHLHFPRFFSRSEYALREREYRTFTDQAECVCVQTEWSRQDVIQQYGIAPEKVRVIQWGSVFDAYTVPSEETRRATASKYKLPSQFFFYPAVTWPHKNHQVIIRALHLLKTECQRTVEVFFTGAITSFRAELDQLARTLGVSGQLHYLGFVTAEELQSIFRNATAMVFASKFEGFGLPILEAFQAGLPILSSSATTLPEIAGDGALYFSPDSAEELAALMVKVLDEPDTRQLLTERGAVRLSQFSMRETAAQFQRLYASMATSHGEDYMESRRRVSVTPL